MRDYWKLLLHGNKAQLEKLRENEHKRGFDDINLFYAYHRVGIELDELKEEMEQLELGNGDYSAIRKEAADIANFAHMIILKCDQELST